MIAPPASPLLRSAAVGFCGKLPARGDFVAAGLPRRFVEPWHDWMQTMLASSRRAFGEDWAKAWNEAPIWRFALPPGWCGPAAALGLWMPSIDRIGRQFPLTVAAVAGKAALPELIRDGGGFLDLAEAAGLDALAGDIEPDELARRLLAAARRRPSPGRAASGLPEEPGAVWWTDGGARVPAGAFVTRSWPDAASFAGMLQADAPVSRACFGGAG